MESTDLSMLGENEHLSLSLIVHRAKCLPEIQLIGIQDPYVIVTTLPSRSSTGKTKYDEDGGTEPVWEAEMQLFPNEFDDTVEIEVWNANIFIDESIGAVRVPLTTMLPTKTRLGLQLNAGGVIECSFALSRTIDSSANAKAKPSIVQGKEAAVIENEPCSNPVLQIEVQRAGNLKNPSMFSSLAPYAVAQVGDFGPVLIFPQELLHDSTNIGFPSHFVHYVSPILSDCTACSEYKESNRKLSSTPQARTRAAPGHCNPTWSVKHSNSLLLVPGEEGLNKVKVKVMNQNLVYDDLIGEVDLTLDYKDLKSKRTITTTLNTGGEVELRLGWQNADSVHAHNKKQGTKKLPQNPFSRNNYYNGPSNTEQAQSSVSNPFSMDQYYQQRQGSTDPEAEETKTDPDEESSASPPSSSVSNSSPANNNSILSKKTLGLFNKAARSFSIDMRSNPDQAKLLSNLDSTEKDLPEVETSGSKVKFELGSRHRMVFGDSYYPIVEVVRPGPNAAAGRRASCTNEEKGYEASKAVDQKRGTYWCSKVNTNEAVFTVDLGSHVTVFQMRINWKFFARHFEILVSNNNDRFVSILTESNGGGDRHIPIPTFTARYCRIHMREAGKTFDGQPILGIVELDLISGIYVKINDGPLTGREYKLDHPGRLVPLDAEPAKYRKSLANGVSDKTTKFGKNKDKAREVILAKTVQKYAIGSQWRLCGSEEDGDLEPAVKVMNVNTDAEVFVQRLIGKPTLICVKDPAKHLRKL